MHSARKERNPGAGRTSAPYNRRIRNALIEAGYRGPEAPSDVRLMSSNGCRRPPTELACDHAPMRMHPHARSCGDMEGGVSWGLAVLWQPRKASCERTEGRCAEITARV